MVEKIDWIIVELNSIHDNWCKKQAIRRRQNNINNHRSGKGNLKSADDRGKDGIGPDLLGLHAECCGYLYFRKLYRDIRWVVFREKDFYEEPDLISGNMEIEIKSGAKSHYRLCVDDDKVLDNRVYVLVVNISKLKYAVIGWMNGNQIRNHKTEKTKFGNMAYFVNQSFLNKMSDFHVKALYASSEAVPLSKE